MFLKTRRPTIITTSLDNLAIEREGDPEGNSPYDTFLVTRKPTVIINTNPSQKRPMLVDDSDIIYDPNVTIIAPLNTDLRFIEKYNKLGKPYGYLERFLDQDQINVERGTVDDSDIIPDVASDDLVIPPLNTDVRIQGALPEFTEAEMGLYAAQPLAVSKLVDMENFSWHIITDADEPAIVNKKKLMHPIQNQHMCGSCWAMALAGSISDCFVVSGAVTWMPRIAPTYLMMTIPESQGNHQCNGGNPASTAKALESIPVADTTCIDYSWCATDKDLCTSAAAANHFSSSLGTKLNKNIPTPNESCYFKGERYLYRIDPHSDALFITDDIEQFRDIIKTHIIEYGPPLAGYAVLRNFVTGNFTDRRVNQGVYFDRASYPASITAGQPLKFSDANSSLSDNNLSGLHAVQVVGWGVAKNVQYDNDKYGDVPFWWGKNSWGSNWGNMGGYFKIAMYPFNRVGQFGKQILVKGTKVGGMILLRCTKPPVIGKVGQVNEQILRTIKRSMPDDFYKMSPLEVAERMGLEEQQQPVENKEKEDVGPIIRGGDGNPPVTPAPAADNTMTYVIVAVVVLLVAAMVMYAMMRK